jgi:hypothetical protein
LRELNPLLAQIVGCPQPGLFFGSLNLWADNPVALHDPFEAHSHFGLWHFVPIILRDVATGIVARRAGSGDIPFLEIFACRALVPLLQLTPEDRIAVRLLPGNLLGQGAA